ncbi:polysaccharide biosynthesis tyrosine autokinase [Sphingomonas donggukensis]|uniref:non-specific protein-tyrosine kinase n=1 Tax=Sphingomonas donggukensis TaxID=2949093 RepID=A0ABY4TRI8_9SPHN|nr:polysaccharide biosynthesis tyrosine autokinase [Sphingomonas donggukensis]URW74440.1 polysaccharide biosynthesis tyrosine autokinase [Sphingomonas donggukensis]
MTVDNPAIDPAQDTDPVRYLVQPEGSENPLTTYMLMLYRRKWLILGFAAAGLLAALLITLNATRLYRATASIEIQREAARVVDQKGVEPPSSVGSMEFYQTQYGLLRSRALAEQVVRKLRLSQNTTLLYGGKAPDQPSGAAAPTRKMLEERAIGAVQAGLVVSPVRGSGLVEVSFSSADPQLSAQVANAIADAFIESTLARRLDATSYARDFLGRQLEALRGRLEDSERRVVEYANREGLITIQTPGKSGESAGEQDLAAIDLAALNTALAEARADRIAAAARSTGQGAQSAALAKSLADPAIASLRQTRADLASQLAKLRVQFKSDYPQVQATERQIAEIDRQLASQQGLVTSSVGADYRAAVERESELQARVDALKGNVLNNRSRSIQYNILQREADTNREQYQALLQRFKEVGIAGGVGVNNISIVDRAMVPSGPYTPRPLVNLLVGLALGTALGAALALLLAQLDETVGTPHDLQSKVGLPLLGSVPLMSSDTNIIDELDDRRSTLVEAYNSVQTSLRFSTSHGVPRTLVITSARPAEGKTTTSVAIARNLALLGTRTLLVDGDMRNPSIHRSLGLPNSKGLSDALTGVENLGGLIHRMEGSSLAVMSSGPLPPNPAELLAGRRLDAVLQALEKDFDHIVIDGPPVLGLADSPLISSHVEATVFVIAANETRSKAARIAIRRLLDARGRVLGAVLTKFNAQQIGYDYGYSYEYGDRRRNA